jgi:hypothetical protein
MKEYGRGRSLMVICRVFYTWVFFSLLLRPPFSLSFQDCFGHPDFLYIVVVFAAYRFGWGTGLLYVYVLGWMMDVVSGIHLGLYPLENIIVFSSLKLLTENSPFEGKHLSGAVGGCKLFFSPNDVLFSLLYDHA